MWVILREVYGRIQNRGTSSATIPTSQFIATTHLPRNRIYEALAWLEKEGLISRVGEISENQDIRKSGYKISGKTVIHIRKSGVLCPEIRISHSLNSNSNKPLRVRKEIRNKEKEKERDATLFKRRNSARLTPSIFED
jgi:DNA-binding PadR family transcriptional regulator